MAGVSANVRNIITNLRASDPSLQVTLGLYYNLAGTGILPGGPTCSDAVWRARPCDADPAGRCRHSRLARNRDRTAGFCYGFRIPGQQSHCFLLA